MQVFQEILLSKLLTEKIYIPIGYANRLKDNRRRITKIQNSKHKTVCVQSSLRGQTVHWIGAQFCVCMFLDSRDKS